MATKLFTPFSASGDCCPEVEPPGSLAHIWHEETCKIDPACLNPKTGFFWTQAQIRAITVVADRPAGWVLPATEDQYAEAVTIGAPIKFMDGYGYVKYATELDKVKYHFKSEGKVAQKSLVDSIDVAMVGTGARHRGFIRKILNSCQTVAIKRKGIDGEIIIMGQPLAKAYLTEAAGDTGEKSGDDNHITYTVSDGGALGGFTYSPLLPPLPQR